MSGPRGQRRAHGWGLATVVTDGASEGTVLDTWFPAPALGDATPRRRAPRRNSSGWRATTPYAACAPRCGTSRSTWRSRPRDAPDAYLRLHLLSHRLVPPHGANLDGIFGALANVVWTSAGPVPGR